MLKALGAERGVLGGYGVTSEVETGGESLCQVAVPVGGAEVELAEAGGEVEEDVVPVAAPVVSGAVGGAVVTVLVLVCVGAPVVASGAEGPLGVLSGVPGGEDVHGVGVTVGSGS
ncbi:hypothetical protein ACFUIY_30125 [Streptomyces griseorubiginosus]|uniref:hypothetical protein n=1 Tax=Streptomyces griseorubiginosus TaxID=67304 RepID=UPI00114047F1|nr:hypothetical protein [Streptomyces griseorubiginosus]